MDFAFASTTLASGGGSGSGEDGTSFDFTRRAEAGTRKRALRVDGLRRAKRAKVANKRRCFAGANNSPSASSVSEGGSPHVLPEKPSARQVPLLLQEFKSGSKERWKGALLRVRRWLSWPESEEDDGTKVAIGALLSGGFVALVLPALTSNACEHAHKIDVLWCLINIASLAHESTVHVLEAVPVLRTIIASDDFNLNSNGVPSTSSIVLREQATWVIGNIAADGQELRNVLISSGIIADLTRIFAHAASPLSLKRTCAWTLSNLARGVTTSLQPFFEAQTHLALVKAVQIFSQSKTGNDYTDVVPEALWALTYLTARDASCATDLVNNGLLSTCVSVLAPRVSASALACGEHIDGEVVLPALRIIGNLVAAPVDEWTRAACGDERFLRVLKILLSRTCLANNRALVKEASWIFANMCAVSPLLRCIVEGPLSPLKEICWLFGNAGFETRREIAFAFANLVRRPNQDVKGVEKLNKIAASKLLLATLAAWKEANASSEENFAESIASLLNAADADLVGSALHLAEAILEIPPAHKRSAEHYASFSAILRPGGVVCFEQVNGIEALDRISYADGMPPGLSRHASRLVDTFYGEDYDCDEQDVEFSFNPPPAMGGVRFDGIGGSVMATAPPSVGRGRALLRPSWMDSS